MADAFTMAARSAVARAVAAGVAAVGENPKHARVEPLKPAQLETIAQPVLKEPAPVKVVRPAPARPAAKVAPLPKPAAKKPASAAKPAAKKVPAVKPPLVKAPLAKAPLAKSAPRRPAKLVRK
jgi:sec-independent protein translocase protein TatB